MEKEAIFEEILEMGKSRGKLTYDEINDVLPSEYFSPEEIEELMGPLHDMGIEVIDDQELDTVEEDLFASEEDEDHEKAEDIIQTYFQSLGNISILTRDEEIELAKRLEEGKEIIKGVVTELPLYKKLEASLDGDKRDALNQSEGEGIDEALEMSLKVLEDLAEKIQIADKKVARYGTLRNLIK